MINDTQNHQYFIVVTVKYLPMNQIVMTHKVVTIKHSN